MSKKRKSGWWNYRLLRHDDEWGGYVTLIEVYYTRKGRIYGWCNASLVQDNVKDFRSDLNSMLIATKAPVLTLDDLPADDVHQTEQKRFERTQP